MTDELQWKFCLKLFVFARDCIVLTMLVERNRAKGAQKSVKKIVSHVIVDNASLKKSFKDKDSCLRTATN